MFSAYKVLHDDLGRVRCPILLFRSAEDHVVDPSSGRAIRSRVASTDVTEEILEDSYHVATLDNDAHRIFEGSLAFVERVAGQTSDAAGGGRAEP
jgi:carboxylesterase